MRRRETRTAWGAEAAHGSLVHGVRLALGVVRISDTVNDQLRLLARDLCDRCCQHVFVRDVQG